MNFTAFRPMLLTLALLSAAPLFGACHFLGSFGDPPQGLSPEGNEDCLRDADCANGDLCISERCIPGCSDDGDCTGRLGVCDTRLDICQECVVDDDCQENERCAFGDCDPLCTNDAECGNGFFCDGNLEVCAPIECNEDGDCEEGACVNNRCEGSQCAPVGSRCEGALLVRCNGQTESRQSCAAGCEIQGGSARCIDDQICEDGARRCRNGLELMVCEDGIVERVERCEEGVERCNENAGPGQGVCAPIDCDPQCGNRECGADPVCGASCGECGDNEVCSQNQCVGDVQPPDGESLVLELTWNSIDGDLDIHLLRNNAQPCDANDDCFWQNCQQGLEWDSIPGISFGDPTLLVDDDQGFGPERIEIPLPQNGRYRVGALAYDLPGDLSPTATLRVFHRGVEIGVSTQVIQNTQEFWEAFDIEVRNQGGTIELEVNGEVLQQQCL